MASGELQDPMEEKKVQHEATEFQPIRIQNPTIEENLDKNVFNTELEKSTLAKGIDNLENLSSYLVDKETLHEKETKHENASIIEEPTPITGEEEGKVNGEKECAKKSEIHAIESTKAAGVSEELHVEENEVPESEIVVKEEDEISVSPSNSKEISEEFNAERDQNQALHEKEESYERENQVVPEIQTTGEKEEKSNGEEVYTGEVQEIENRVKEDKLEKEVCENLNETSNNSIHEEIQSESEKIEEVSHEDEGTNEINDVIEGVKLKIDEKGKDALISTEESNEPSTLPEETLNTEESSTSVNEEQIEARVEITGEVMEKDITGEDGVKAVSTGEALVEPEEQIQKPADFNDEISSEIRDVKSDLENNGEKGETGITGEDGAKEVSNGEEIEQGNGEDIPPDKEEFISQSSNNEVNKENAEALVETEEQINQEENHNEVCDNSGPNKEELVDPIENEQVDVKVPLNEDQIVNEEFEEKSEISVLDEKARVVCEEKIETTIPNKETIQSEQESIDTTNDQDEKKHEESTSEIERNLDREEKVDQGRTEIRQVEEELEVGPKKDQFDSEKLGVEEIDSDSLVNETSREIDLKSSLEETRELGEISLINSEKLVSEEKSNASIEEKDDESKLKSNLDDQEAHEIIVPNEEEIVDPIETLEEKSEISILDEKIEAEIPNNDETTQFEQESIKTTNNQYEKKQEESNENIVELTLEEKSEIEKDVELKEDEIKDQLDSEKLGLKEIDSDALVSETSHEIDLKSSLEETSAPSIQQELGEIAQKPSFESEEQIDQSQATISLIDPEKLVSEENSNALIEEKGDGSELKSSLDEISERSIEQENLEADNTQNDRDLDREENVDESEVETKKDQVGSEKLALEEIDSNSSLNEISREIDLKSSLEKTQELGEITNKPTIELEEQVDQSQTTISLINSEKLVSKEKLNASIEEKDDESTLKSNLDDQEAREIIVPNEEEVVDPIETLDEKSEISILDEKIEAEIPNNEETTQSKQESNEKKQEESNENMVELTLEEKSEIVKDVELKDDENKDQLDSEKLGLEEIDSDALVSETSQEIDLKSSLEETSAPSIEHELGEIAKEPSFESEEQIDQSQATISLIDPEKLVSEENSNALIEEKDDGSELKSNVDEISERSIEQESIETTNDQENNENIVEFEEKNEIETTSNEEIRSTEKIEEPYNTKLEEKNLEADNTQNERDLDCEENVDQGQTEIPRVEESEVETKKDQVDSEKIALEEIDSNSSLNEVSREIDLKSSLEETQELGEITKEPSLEFDDQVDRSQNTISLITSDKLVSEEKPNPLIEGKDDESELKSNFPEISERSIEQEIDLSQTISSPVEKYEVEATRVDEVISEKLEDESEKIKSDLEVNDEISIIEREKGEEQEETPVLEETNPIETIEIIASQETNEFEEIEGNKSNEITKLSDRKIEEETQITEVGIKPTEMVSGPENQIKEGEEEVVSKEEDISQTLISEEIENTDLHSQNQVHDKIADVEAEIKGEVDKSESVDKDAESKEELEGSSATTREILTSEISQTDEKETKEETSERSVEQEIDQSQTTSSPVEKYEVEAGKIGEVISGKLEDENKKIKSSIEENDEILTVEEEKGEVQEEIRVLEETNAIGTIEGTANQETNEFEEIEETTELIDQKIEQEIQITEVGNKPIEMDSYEQEPENTFKGEKEEDKSQTLISEEIENTNFISENQDQEKIPEVEEETKSEVEEYELVDKEAEPKEELEESSTKTRDIITTDISQTEKTKEHLEEKDEQIDSNNLAEETSREIDLKSSLEKSSAQSIEQELGEITKEPNLELISLTDSEKLVGEERSNDLIEEKDIETETKSNLEGSIEQENVEEQLVQTQHLEETIEEIPNQEINEFEDLKGSKLNDTSELNLLNDGQKREEEAQLTDAEIKPSEQVVLKEDKSETLISEEIENANLISRNQEDEDNKEEVEEETKREIDESELVDKETKLEESSAKTVEEETEEKSEENTNQTENKETENNGLETRDFASIFGGFIMNKVLSEENVKTDEISRHNLESSFISKESELETLQETNNEKEEEIEEENPKEQEIDNGEENGEENGEKSEVRHDDLPVSRFLMDRILRGEDNSEEKEDKNEIIEKPIENKNEIPVQNDEAFVVEENFEEDYKEEKSIVDKNEILIQNDEVVPTEDKTEEDTNESVEEKPIEDKNDILVKNDEKIEEEIKEETPIEDRNETLVKNDEKIEEEIKEETPIEDINEILVKNDEKIEEEIKEETPIEDINEILVKNDEKIEEEIKEETPIEDRNETLVKNDEKIEEEIKEETPIEDRNEILVKNDEKIEETPIEGINEILVKNDEKIEEEIKEEAPIEDINKILVKNDEVSFVEEKIIEGNKEEVEVKNEKISSMEEEIKEDSKEKRSIMRDDETLVKNGEVSLVEEKIKEDNEEEMAIEDKNEISIKINEIEKVKEDNEEERTIEDKNDISIKNDEIEKIKEDNTNEGIPEEIIEFEKNEERNNLVEKIIHDENKKEQIVGKNSDKEIIEENTKEVEEIKKEEIVRESNKVEGEVLENTDEKNKEEKINDEILLEENVKEEDKLVEEKMKLEEKIKDEVAKDQKIVEEDVNINEIINEERAKNVENIEENYVLVQGKIDPSETNPEETIKKENIIEKEICEVEIPNKEEKIQFTEKEKVQIEEKKSQEVNEKIKDEREEENDDEHEEEEEERVQEERESDGKVVAREIETKTPQKKSLNILSGVGSKVKHSLAKVKKAITGKSKNSSPIK